MTNPIEWQGVGRGCLIAGKTGKTFGSNLFFLTWVLKNE